LLGNDAGLRARKSLLIERTEGNPFFLEESVRTLVETKVLAGERGAHQLVRASPTLQIPATAQAMLAARIDRLAPAYKGPLQVASVIGKDVPFTRSARASVSRRPHMLGLRGGQPGVSNYAIIRWCRRGDSNPHTLAGTRP
jgi:hypothetical protein